MPRAELVDQDLAFNPDASRHEMQCMEVWGGNHAISSGVSIPGVDAWVYSQPFRAQSAGGDIYYVSMCGQGRVGRFILADVSGHGEEVSETANRLRNLMRKSIMRPDQTAIARGLNRQFGRLRSRGVFATAVMLTYFAPTDQLICCLAGHPRPLIYRAQSGRWSFLTEPSQVENLPPRGLPLGVIPKTEYCQFAVTLARGDIIVAYTDALIEARRNDEEMIGEQGLLSIVESLRVGVPAHLGLDLIDAIDRHAASGSATRKDDLTVLVLHHNAADPTPPSLSHRLRMMIKMMGL